MRSSQWLFGAVALTCLLAGCQSTRAESPTAVRLAPPKAVPGTTLHAGPGETEAFDEKRFRLWTLHWESAEVRGAGTKATVSDVVTVHGSFFRNNKPAGNYEAATGSADQAKSRLELRGSVRITSLQHKTTLLCAEANYDGIRKIIQARGKVRLVSDDGTTDFGDEVVATPELDRVGTPETFGNASEKI